MTYRKEVVRGVLIAMPKRDRGFGFWVVTALFIAALLSLILAFTYDVATSHTERKLRAEQNSSGYVSSAEKRVDEACGGLSGGDLIACVQQEVEATNEHKRSEYDLTAQQDMDDWSFWLLWVSVSSVAVSTLAVILVWRTLDVTRETLIATQDMARDTREIGEAQVRAYLTARQVQVACDAQHSCLSFRCNVSNHGQSPAVGAFALIEVTLFVNDTRVVFRMFHEIGILPVGENKGELCGYVDSNISPDLFQTSGACHVQIRVIAKDVFGKDIESSGFFMARGGPQNVVGYVIENASVDLGMMGLGLDEADFAHLVPNWWKPNWGQNE
ncbi:MAG: hypothetical protein P1U75_12320 [Antarcticimicrobium sp.]|uniref:hypothetical protein n=1 Tax=Antarcticimicrobium sp. TaxID=2824147 RepID=UPI0026135B9F|nr:hypothetical protein [Antarcticimicrobium sp.]MDF1717439.1 hypothetical protein [Antarcticimicrobium sp.]